MTRGVRVPPIELVVDTAADPDTAWRTLTEPARVALWLTEASVPRRVGDTYRLDFGEGSIVRGEILVLDQGHVFAHRWAWDGAQAGERTLVTWVVQPLEGGTRISLRHDGWEEAGLDATARDDHATYWAGYLEDLRDVLEEA